MELVRFKNARELLSWLDSEIAKTRSTFEELKSRLESLKRKAEVERRIESLLREIAGEPRVGRSETRLGELRILVNPQPVEELEVLEKLLEATSLKLQRLESARKLLEPLGAVGEEPVVVELVVEEGAPRNLIIRI